ncbi:elongation factor G [Vagococcus salmoninarum]|uniref:elongation factor G n=1 Tax=Vagococcus salmoninarum TaxID=2739 RepID=UPI0018824EDB|nr:TetM/TetW/TetO/TetS family tetracycline resistance ribosomal protection protein [Vagococcus salmoninarum]MBE9388208.1 TetM/TetW/TetO/TetS family tetracycline resistance ribosomal protection protein [Vagococcus salmoninarum]
MKRTIGIFAHVDAGKTTFSESLLYLTKQIKEPGRVDNGNTVLDHNQLEQQRGITIFSDTALFSWGENDFQLIDTPGHPDFSAEMEQTIAVLDLAILLISATDGVQSHTLTLYRLLKKNQIPVYFFINKRDLPTADLTKSLLSITEQLTPDCCVINELADFTTMEYQEWLCQFDDDLLEAYFAESLTTDSVLATTQRLITAGKITLVGTGSALKHQGIESFFNVINQTSPWPLTSETTFTGQVYQINYDQQDQRVTYLKCLSGRLEKKMEILVNGQLEKINEIRLYSGSKYQLVETALPGDLVGVTGLKHSTVGTTLGLTTQVYQPSLLPLLRASVVLKDSPLHEVLKSLKKIEEQMPRLNVSFEPLIQQISVHIMGKIQLEILKAILATDYGLDVDFAQAQVIYQESIQEPVMGYAHFEPLRHYAEVHLQLLPSEHEQLTFSSDVSLEQLNLPAQNLIGASLHSRLQKGMLTGSPLTKIHVILKNGAMHLEHSSKGDIREATWRAIRQGLEKADNVLLEPWYAFEITLPTTSMGRVLTDIPRLHGHFDPPTILQDLAIITGLGPVATFIDYQEELIAFTQGLGVMTLTYHDYLPCHNREEVIAKIAYEKERDLEYTSSSVFLKGPAGFEVKWFDVEEYLHI